MGLVAPWHVGSSWTRARTRVPCIGRQILNHCANREVLQMYSYGLIENLLLLHLLVRFLGWRFMAGEGFDLCKNADERM